jgi:selenium-binding protein 1
MHVWDLRRRRHLQALDLGSDQQMVLEMRPAHNPTKAYGFVGVVVSLKDLSASVWLWHRDNGAWGLEKVIEIPAEPADPAKLPAMLKDFKAVPPLVTDINLSLDDKFLYVACWGTGEMLQYDVSDPFNPKKCGSVRIGGIVNRTSHPKKPDRPLAGGPQMVEVSRDGKRVYFTNSLYATWDEQFYPDGVGSWMVKLEADPQGGIKLTNFLSRKRLSVHWDPPRRRRSSSDSYLFSVRTLWPWLVVFALGLSWLEPGHGWLAASGCRNKNAQRCLGCCRRRSYPGHALSIELSSPVLVARISLPYRP